MSVLFLSSMCVCKTFVFGFLPKNVVSKSLFDFQIGIYNIQQFSSVQFIWGMDLLLILWISNLNWCQVIRNGDMHRTYCIFVVVIPVLYFYLSQFVSILCLFVLSSISIALLKPQKQSYQTWQFYHTDGSEPSRFKCNVFSVTCSV